jgi:hypothetical protein
LKKSSLIKFFIYLNGKKMHTTSTSFYRQD